MAQQSLSGAFLLILDDIWMENVLCIFLYLVRDLQSNSAPEIIIPIENYRYPSGSPIYNIPVFLIWESCSRIVQIWGPREEVGFSAHIFIKFHHLFVSYTPRQRLGQKIYRFEMIKLDLKGSYCLKKRCHSSSIC